jgi:hypothetical protein
MEMPPKEEKEKAREPFSLDHQEVWPEAAYKVKRVVQMKYTDSTLPKWPKSYSSSCIPIEPRCQGKNETCMKI